MSERVSATVPHPFTNMDVNHVDGELKKKSYLRSIFQVLNNLFSEKGRNGNQFIALLDSIVDRNVTVGSSTSLQYSLKRFVRSLSSAELNSQCASFSSLTCLLKYELTSAEEILDILDAEINADHSRNESKSLNISCVLTCGAIIQSGIFPSLATETKEKVLTKLITCGNTKQYLRSITNRFLIEVSLTVDEDDFKTLVWPMFKREMKSTFVNGDVYNYDFLLACHRRFPQIIGKFIEKHENSFESFVEKIVTLLVNGYVLHDEPIYERVCQVLVKNKKLLLRLWTECVNNRSKSKSSFKDKVVITLFYFILKNLTEEKVIPKLLVPKFIETIIMILSFRKTKKFDNIDCHPLAKSSFDLLVTSLIKEGVPDSVRFKTIEKLMFYPANMKFEKKTGTKCIQSLIMHLNKDSLKQLTEIHCNIVSGDLKKVVDEEGTSEDWNNNEKQYVLHIFVKLLHHPSVKGEKDWKLKQIKFLYDIGFKKNNKLHSNVQKCARDCFYKAIEIQMPNLEDVLELLDELVGHVNEQIENGLVELSDSATQSWRKVFSTIQKLKSKNKLFIAIHLLLIHMGLQLFADGNLAMFNIDELLACYSRLQDMHKKKNKEQKEELHWSEVTVDLMLSLLSREDKLWRYVVCNLVFPQMVKHITPSALHQIIDVLNPQSTDKILNDEQSDVSDEEAEDDDEDDEDEDEEEKEKSESSLTESENDENVTLNDQLRLAVKDALGMSAALTDQESVDMDDMDEEEERKLNERLSEAFKMFKTNTGRQTKKQTKEQKMLTHFRFRVLDLVEIYVTNGATVVGCLDLLFPLFNLLELSIKDPNERILYHRVDSILKKLSSVKKFPDLSDLTEKLIVDHFEVLLSRKEVPSMIFVEMAPRISDCCAFLVRCSQLLPNTSSEIPLVSNYSSLLDNFFHSRDNKLPITLFQSVLRSAWPGNWQLISALFDLLVDPSIKLYKKMKAIELLDIFYKNSNLHASAGGKTLSELNKIENKFVTNFTAYLIEYQSKKVKTNDKMFLAFFVGILSLITIAYKSFKRHRSESNKLPRWKDLVSKMGEIEVVATTKKSRRLIGYLADVFDVTLPEVKPRERANSESSIQKGEGTEEDDEEGGDSLENDDGDDGTAEEQDEEVTKKKKKRKWKLTAEKAKMKKESLKLREAMGNDGIGLVPFSSVDVYTIPEEVNDAEEDPSEPKEKKRKLGKVNGVSPTKKNVH